jgi:uncharacterized membrane protein YraQ (UPF0718 family)
VKRGACTGETSVARPWLFDLSDPRQRAGARFAFDLLREIGPWIVARVLIGAAIAAFVPEHLSTQYLGGASCYAD